MFQNNLLMAADAATSGGGADVVSVGNSALFDSANSESLTRAFGAPDSTTKGTFRTILGLAGGLGSYRVIFGAGTAGTDFMNIRLDASDNLQIIGYVSNTLIINKITSMRFRDVLSFYDIVCRFDSTNATASSRFILEVNGVTITDFSTDTGLTLNSRIWLAENLTSRIGRHGGTDLHYGNFYLAETSWLDNNLEPASSFGEFDTTGLYWTPKSSTVIKALTFGTNGFYLDNTTNAETDASGEGNNFTNNNTVVTSTNTPTRLWPLFNPLGSGAGGTFSNGRTKVTYAPTGTNYSTFGFPGTGKFVAQCTVEDMASNGIGWICLNAEGGVQSSQFVLNQARWVGLTGGNWIGVEYVDYSFNVLGVIKTSAADDDVIQLEWDNGTMSFQINGTRYTPSDFTAPDTSKTWAFMSRCAGVGIELWDFGQGGFTPVDTSYSYLNTEILEADTTRTASDTNKYFQTTLYEGNGAGQRVGAFQPFDSTFTIAKSSLFHGAADEFLVRTNDEAQSNTKKFTYSTWIKRSATLDSDANALLSAGSGTSNGRTDLKFLAGSATGSSTYDELRFELYNSSLGWITRDTSIKLASQSEWYHVVLVYDAENSTAIDTLIIYINGVRQTLSSASAIPDNISLVNANGSVTRVGADASATEIVFKGYMANTAMCDGQAYAASDFGVTDTSTNRWVPKDITGLTFGTNGFLFQYQDSSALGDDTSGNTNDFANGSGVTQTTDSPTTNLATFDGNTSTVAPLSNGNRTVSSTGLNDNMNGISTLPLEGKVYFEFVPSTLAANSSAGVTTNNSNFDTYAGGDSTSWGWYLGGGDIYYGGSVSNALPATLSAGVIGCIALDMDAGSMWTGQVSGTTITWDNSGNPETGANPVIDGSIDTDQTWYVVISGRNSSVSTVYFASSDWTGATNRPASFKALTQDNMAGTDQFISAFSWIKNRDATDNHMLFDRVRGATKDLHSNTSDVEVTNTNTVQSFLEAGVQVGTDVQVNTANESYVLWNWMIENTGSGASNEDGSINTTSTLVDTTLGLSISTYTGTGANATFGHGLGVAPKFIIIKGLTNGELWQGFASGLGPTKATHLNNTSVSGANSVYWNNTAPTSTLVSLGSTGGNNGSTIPFVAYCFAPSQFISIGSYEGNGNANGAFIPTVNSLGVPIQPVWAITKSIDSTSNWDVYDKERLGYNPENAHLDANLTTVESTADNLDIVTGGLKMRIATDPNVAETYVYMAIGTPMIDTDGRIIAGR
jgi:hypothetical protein